MKKNLLAMATAVALAALSHGAMADDVDRKSVV